MTYEETKKMDEFVGRIYEAGDMVTKHNHPDPRKWPKNQIDLWGMLDDLGMSGQRPYQTGSCMRILRGLLAR